MEVVKTENPKEEMTDTDTDILSSIQVGSEECMHALTLKCDIPGNEVGLASLKYEEDIKAEEVTSQNIEICIKTETNEMKDVDIKEHELSYEPLESMKFENYKTEHSGNEYIEPTAAKCNVLLNKLDFGPGQYVSEMEAVKHEQNIGKEDTSHVIEVYMEKQKTVQQGQPDYFEYKTGDVEGHCTLKTNIERHKSAFKAEDKSTQQTPRENVKYFKCLFCEYIAKKAHNLKMHFIAKHSKNAELYQCFNCEYKTKLKTSLAQHCRVLHNKKIEWHECNLCDFKTKHKGSLTHHRLKHDNLAKIFHCKQCDFKTKNKYNFSQHHRLKHDDAAEVFRCELCDFETKNKHYMFEHHRLKHDDAAEVFHCEFCDFKTKKKYNLLKRHSLKHVDAVEIFHCELCNFKTKYKHNLLMHHKFKHDDDAELFQCEFCNYKTKSKQYLVRHRSKHDDTAQSFHCKVCNYKTKRRYLLLQHHRSRHNDWDCEVLICV